MTLKTAGSITYQEGLALAKQLTDLNIFISIDKNIDTLRLPKGRLNDMTIALKDTIHTKGLPNTAGTPTLKHFIPTDDAPAVKRLRDSGAIIFGKANMHELSFGITSNNSHYGPVKNPYDVNRFAGGSSGGSAAAVAAGIVPAAIAADTGGSIRIPAALCGVIGFRPSPGRYPMQGITPVSRTRDVIGPMAHHMSDIALIDSVLSARPQVTEVKTIKDLRIGVPREPFYQDLHPETAAVMDKALTTLEAAGVTLVELKLSGLPELVEHTEFSIALYELIEDMTAYLKEHQTGVDFFDLATGCVSPDVSDMFCTLAKDDNQDGIPDGIVSKDTYKTAMNVHRQAMIQLYADHFSASNLDALVFPTTPLPAGLIEGSRDTIEHNGKQVPTFPTYARNTQPASIAGLPAISIPIGMTDSGLPIAMELDGKAGEDEELLALSLALEPLFEKLPAPDLLR